MPSDSIPESDMETTQAAAATYSLQTTTGASYATIPVDASGVKGFRTLQMSVSVEQLGGTLGQTGLQFSLDGRPSDPLTIGSFGQVYFDSGGKKVSFGIFNANATTTPALCTVYPSPPGMYCNVPFTMIVGKTYTLSVEERVRGTWRARITSDTGAITELGELVVPAPMGRIVTVSAISSVSGSGTCTAAPTTIVRFGEPVADGGWPTKVFWSGTRDPSCPGATPLYVPGTHTFKHFVNFTQHARYAVVTGGDFDGDGVEDWATISPNALGAWNSTVDPELSSAGQRCGADAECPAGSQCQSGICTSGLVCSDDADCSAGNVCQNGTCGSAGPMRSASWSTVTPTDMRTGGPESKYVTLAGDFDGDGKDDLVTFSADAQGWESALAVDLSTGSSFTHARWACKLPGDMRIGGAASDYRTIVGDYNGDGKDDLMTMSTNATGGWTHVADMMLSTGTGFRSVQWETATPKDMRSGGATANYRVLGGDFNGDGKDDVATISQNGTGWNWIAVDLSTGSGFTHARWASTTPADMKAAGSSAKFSVWSRDFNGDGKTDIAVLSTNATGVWASTVSVDLSTGSGFTRQKRTSTLPGLLRAATITPTVVVNDFNGDRAADFAAIVPDGSARGSLTYEVTSGSKLMVARKVISFTGAMFDAGTSRPYNFAGPFFPGGRAAVCAMSPTAAGEFSSNILCDVFSETADLYTTIPAATPVHMRQGLW